MSLDQFLVSINLKTLRFLLKNGEFFFLVENEILEAHTQIKQGYCSANDGKQHPHHTHTKGNKNAKVEGSEREKQTAVTQ
jgi:hypothetical protein